MAGRTAAAPICLEASELDAILRASPHGLCIHSGERVLWVNDAIARTFGYASPDDMVGLSVFDFVHPEERPIARERVLRALETGALEPREYRCLRADGTIVSLEVAPLRVSFEGSAAILLALRDVSAEKQRRMRMVMNDRLMSLGAAAAGIGHEISNPLTSAALLAGHVRRLLERGALAPEVLPHLAELQAGLEQITHVVRDVRTLVTPQVTAEEHSDVRAALDIAANLASHLLAPRALLVKDYHEVPHVRGNRPRLVQVFLNLLSNAAAAVAPGRPGANEVRIVVRPAPFDGSGPEGPERGGVAVEVRDSGAGIAPEHRERVFEPFFSTKEPGEGTGLGLSISRDIVNELSGTIAIDSRPGEGTIVRVWLPAADL